MGWKHRGEVAIGSRVTAPRLEDQFGGDGGCWVACCDQPTSRTPRLLPAGESGPKKGSKLLGGSWVRRPRTCVPRRAGVCRRCRRSHGATSRGRTPRPPDSPLPPHGAQGGGGALVSGPARRRLRRARPFHSNPRGRAPPRPGARPVHARAEAQAPPVFPRALAEVLVPRGAGGVPRTPRGREARLRASPSKETATPGGGAAAQLCPSPPRLKKGQPKLSGCARERRQAGAVPAGSAKNIQL